jgi:rare lipoprotein A
MLRTSIKTPYHAIILVLMMILLSSCSHTSRKDGPPDFYVDETKIPNAVPKPEPLAKSGNYKSYIVFGKRYYTLRSSRYYEEVGIASWYGTKFHTRYTSSGERYNMLGMTAAHKTLPLPTYVEVVNLKNQRTIIVKVNDRGPFATNRIIDLSYVAAKKLGMLGHGTALVKVKAINPYTVVPAAKRTLSGVGPHTLGRDHGFYLQVGAFRSQFNAEKYRRHLATLLSTRVMISHPSAGGTLYRVRIGPFKNLTSANQMTSRLKDMGIYPSKGA